MLEIVLAHYDDSDSSLTFANAFMMKGIKAQLLAAEEALRADFEKGQNLFEESRKNLSNHSRMLYSHAFDEFFLIRERYGMLTDLISNFDTYRQAAAVRIVEAYCEDEFVFFNRGNELEQVLYTASEVFISQVRKVEITNPLPDLQAKEEYAAWLAELATAEQQRLAHATQESWSSRLISAGRNLLQSSDDVTGTAHSARGASSLFFGITTGIFPWWNIGKRKK